jgi:hypothetical protein
MRSVDTAAIPEIENEAKKSNFDQALAAEVLRLGGSQDGSRQLPNSKEFIYPVYVPPQRAEEFRQFLESQGYECEGDGPGKTATFASDRGKYVAELLPKQQYVQDSTEQYFFRITGNF